MKFINFLVLLTFFSFISCKSKDVEPTIVYESSSLKIEKISEHVYKHVSYLKTDDFGNVACNGIIFESSKEALVFDTPTTDKVSLELIDWIETTLKSNVKGVVVNHFHDDCLGGLNAFHQKGIPSYANKLTLELAKEDSVTVPQKGYIESLELTIGGKKVINKYFGAGHTTDNTVSYIPSEKVLFGGCMVKALNASKGYLGAANISEWPKTVAKIKSAFPKAKGIVPGHGKVGGTELLDYTIELFEEKN